MTNKNDKLSFVDYLLKYGKIWKNYGKRRIYFNTEQSLNAGGYEVEFYKTGIIKLVRKNGEVVSNNYLTKLLLLSVRGNCFYDLDKCEFFRASAELVDSIMSNYKLLVDD